MSTIAYVISSHGFGHAARACAVMAAVARRAPNVRFEIFTGTPAWFFEESLGPKISRRISHHNTVTDFGLVQTDALQEDLTATLRELRPWIPFPEDKIAPLARSFEELECRLVICDIAPLGLVAARRAGLPSILVENFTWDFIYRGYGSLAPDLLPLAEHLAEAFAGADTRVQTEPFCQSIPGAHPVPPVSRAPRQSRGEIRRRLGVPPGAAMVLVTMGGIEWDYSSIESDLEQRFAAQPSTVDAAGRGRDCWLVIPGGSREHRARGRLIRLPHRSEFYHPDLVHAADAVLGKLGYSTLAEVWSANIPMGYVPRHRFPESPPLEAWVQQNLPHRRIEPERFKAGTWLDDVEALLTLKPRGGSREGGAEQVADFILGTATR